MTPASDASLCGCCEGMQPATPQALVNRPGLPQIAYRIGDWATFRSSMLAALSVAARPALAGLRTRDGDDFTIGLVDAFACVADVLTFYQERTANEHYLRTAIDRGALAELGKLIGYRPRPGVAAETWLAFTVETAPPAPAELPPEPGAFVTGVPASIALPARLKVQSVPGPGEKAQTFETVESVAEARAAWNAMRPWFGVARAPRAGDTAAFLAGVRTGLRPGDAIVLAHDDFLANPEGGSERWEMRILSAVKVDPARDRTRIEFVRPLANVNPAGTLVQTPRVFAMRRRAAAFGHNAPMWASMPNLFKDVYPGGKASDGTYASDWPAFKASARAPDGSVAWIDLDAVVAEFAAGGWAVVAKGDFNHPGTVVPVGTATELYRVRATSEVSRAEFGLSGKVTRLELAGENFAAQFHDAPRALTVFGASEELVLAETPVDDAVQDKLVPLAVAADGLLPGRRLIVRGTDAAGALHVHLSTIHAVTPQGGRCTVELDDALPGSLGRDSVVVHGNVALASHGETATEILGSGDATGAFAQFELKSLPLTWRAATTDSGVAPEITLRVGDIAWQARDSLYGAPPDARAYTLEVDAAGRLWARFGDGLRGARLPTGQNNVRATLRKGLGSAGNVRADSLTQLASRPLGLKGVSNPAPVSGGTEPEAAAALRATLPLATRTLGRVVSVLDYEDHARAFAGIAKAQAELLPLRGGRTVVVTVAAPDGAPLTSASPVWGALLSALREAGDPMVRVELASARQVTFEIGIRVRSDPAYDAAQVRAAVEAALHNAFGFDARALAQPVQASEVVAVAHGVPGVIAVDLDLMRRTTAQGRPTQPRLLASRARVAADGSVQGAELLTLAPAPLAALGAM